MTPTDNDFSIYIHIPFCKQACSYCDFYFVTRQHLIDDYVAALINEISNVKSFITAINPDFISSPHQSFPRTLKTIYFGGGTPSRLNAKQISDILQVIKEQFDIDHVTEITFEVNPDDIDIDYLTNLKSLGVNRLSMGIQSFDPGLLTFMNRAHTAEEALMSLEMVNIAGFDSYSVDLIYGNPGQSNETLERDLELLLSFKPPHVSAYALTIEPDTRLGKYVKMGRLEPVDDGVIGEQMELVNTRLEYEDILRYEVSNFARSGFESKHNSSYWNHVPYLGFGPGGHSLWYNSDSRDSLIRDATRWDNPRDLKKYISDLGLPTFIKAETISTLQLSEERLLMGLRTKNGISLEELDSRYNFKLSSRQIDWIHRPENQQFITMNNDFVQITDFGLPIADRIILDLVTKS
jgi:oxygen-independent coproporphyrinogen-3 oxidase